MNKWEGSDQTSLVALIKDIDKKDSLAIHLQNMPGHYFDIMGPMSWLFEENRFIEKNFWKWIS
jgi:hypothetical protein